MNLSDLIDVLRPVDATPFAYGGNILSDSRTFATDGKILVKIDLLPEPCRARFLEPNFWRGQKAMGGKIPSAYTDTAQAELVPILGVKLGEEEWYTIHGRDEDGTRDCRFFTPLLEVVTSKGCLAFDAAKVKWLLDRSAAWNVTIAGEMLAFWIDAQDPKLVGLLIGMRPAVPLSGADTV